MEWTILYDEIAFYQGIFNWPAYIRQDSHMNLGNERLQLPRDIFVCVIRGFLMGKLSSASEKTVVSLVGWGTETLNQEESTDRNYRGIGLQHVVEQVSRR